MKHFKANFYYFDAKTVYAYVKIIRFLCNWHTFIPYLVYAYLTKLNTQRPNLIQHQLFLLWKFSTTYKIRIV